MKKGSKAPQAAGEIHSDFERGFISAEIINYETFGRNRKLENCQRKGIDKIRRKRLRNARRRYSGF